MPLLPCLGSQGSWDLKGPWCFSSDLGHLRAFNRAFQAGLESRGSGGLHGGGLGQPGNEGVHRAPVAPYPGHTVDHRAGPAGSLGLQAVRRSQASELGSPASHPCPH